VNISDPTQVVGWATQSSRSGIWGSGGLASDGTYVFGVTGAGGSTLHRVSTVISHLGKLNGWTLALAAGVFAIAMVAERINRKIPGALIGVIGSIVLVAAANLEHRTQ